jgi:uroporphyrinogen-III synthase
MPPEVLISTRILSAAAAARIKRAGLQLLEADLIYTEPIPFEWPELNQFSHIAFTSSRAVEAWFKVSDIDGLVPAAISGKTRHTLAGFTKAEIVAAADARSLGQTLHQSAKGKILSVLHPCSQIRLPDLQQELGKTGHHYSPLPVYATLERPVRFSVEPSAVLFFSPSAVNVFFSQNPFNPQTCYACIGSTSRAAVLKRFPEALCLIPGEPDPEQLIDITIDKINKKTI